MEPLIASSPGLLIDKFKHEDLENQATINQVPLPLSAERFGIEASYQAKTEKLDDVLERETRGVDFKGNVRYFCPKCNVRYIGEWIFMTRKIIQSKFQFLFI